MEPAPTMNLVAALTSDEDLECALGLIRDLSEGIGGRRPTGDGESAAAELLSGALQDAGLKPRREPFAGYSTFALPFAVVMGLAVSPALLPRRRRAARAVLGGLATAGLISEGSLRTAPISRFFSRSPSRNVLTEIEPREPAERTLCLMAHMDTSRSGLIFHPRLVGLMGRWITANSVAVPAAAALELLAGRLPVAGRLAAGLRLWLAVSLGLLAEREIRGVDVPGANDNASGCGVVMALAKRLADAPLERTRVVVLLTGCEESGTLGARAFRDSHASGDMANWLFLNFDNVGGPGTVRFLRREGVIAKWDADAGLISAAEGVAARRPDLRFAPEDSPAGLTYDTSPLHAVGLRALTISVQDGFIPDLHWPTDVFGNVDPDGVRRTIEAGAELIAAIDRGEAS